MKLSLGLLLVVVLPLAIHAADSVPATTAPTTTAKTDSKSEHLCGENPLAVVNGSDNMNFTLLNKKDGATYKASDFEVKSKKPTSVNHPFWNWLSKYGNFHDNFVKMGCQVVDKKTFGKVCGYDAEKVDAAYKKHFGPDIVFRCKIPKGYFGMNVRFEVKLDSLKSNVKG